MSKKNQRDQEKPVIIPSQEIDKNGKGIYNLSCKENRNIKFSVIKNIK